MKKIVVAYLYLLLSPSLASPCQCPDVNKAEIYLNVNRKKPSVGETLCFCCKSTALVYPVTIKNDNATVCSVDVDGAITSNNTCSTNSFYTMLQINNVTNKESGNWTCFSKYDQSNTVKVNVLSEFVTTTHSNTKSISTSSTVSSSYTSMRTSSKLSTELTTIRSTPQNNPRDDFFEFGASTIGFIVLVLVIIIYIIFRRCKFKRRRPYDRTLPGYSGLSRTTNNRPFNAEELLQLGTPRGVDDGSSYLSLNRARVATPGVGGALGGSTDGEGGASEEGGATGGFPQLTQVEKNVMSILTSNLQNILHSVEIHPCSNTATDAAHGQPGQRTSTGGAGDANALNGEDNGNRIHGSNNERDSDSNDGYHTIDEKLKSNPAVKDDSDNLTSVSDISEDLTDVSSKSTTDDLDNAYLHPIFEKY